MFGQNLYIRRVGKRVLSTVSEAVSNKGVDGNAGEAGSSSKNTKFIIIGVPLMILGAVVTDIVCKVNHRTALEKVFPSFVSLVREHYGFDDEDPSELARIKLVKAEQAKSIEVNVYSENGLEVSLPNVDGKQSITALLESIVSQNGSGSNLSLVDRIKLLQSVNFPDSNESDEMNNIANGDFKTEEHTREMQPLRSDLSPLQRSVWDSLPSEQQQEQKSLPSSSTQVHIRNIVYDRFLNFYHSFNTGLHEYVEQGNQRIPLGDYQASEGSNKAVQPTRRRPKAASTPATDINKIRAKQRIQDIQLEIKELEHQKQLGIREIDAVDSDIQAKRQEITNIQRQYLNYFYYF